MVLMILLGALGVITLGLVWFWARAHGGGSDWRIALRAPPPQPPGWTEDIFGDGEFRYQRGFSVNDERIAGDAEPSPTSASAD